MVSLGNCYENKETILMTDKYRNVQLGDIASGNNIFQPKVGPVIFMLPSLGEVMHNFQ